MRNNAVKSAERYRNILLHIWKWKLATPASLHKLFFKGHHFQNCFKHTKKLEKRGDIKVVYDLSGKNIAWSLTRKGFMSIKPFLSDLKEDGYKSECPDHDVLLNSVQFEGFIDNDLSFVDIITEQELRRYKTGTLPSWVPKIQFRRPDGYWRVKYKNKDKSDIIAVEVELSRKTDADYRSISNVYASDESIRRVIWLVPTMKQVKRLNEILNEKQKKSYNKHNIIMLDDYYKNLWKADILEGPEKHNPMGLLLGFVPFETGLPANYSPILDGRKYPIKSEGYKIYGIG